jgi:hypothetical protein
MQCNAKTIISLEKFGDFLKKVSNIVGNLSFKLSIVLIAKGEIKFIGEFNHLLDTSQ